MFIDRIILKLLTLLFLVQFANCKSQDYSFFPETIQKTAGYYNKGEYVKAMDFNINALKKYEKNGNKEGIVTIYTNIGFLLFSYNKLQESIAYLDKAKEEMGDDNNPLFSARIYSEYAKNYTRLGMLDKSNTFFDKAIQYTEEIPVEKQKKYLLFYIYTWKRLNFLAHPDSLRSIDRKALINLPSALTYTKIADRFIENNVRLDSAEYYLNKACSAPDRNFILVEGITLFSYGNLYAVKGDHEKTLHYYLKSLSTFKKGESKILIRKAYDSLSSVYSAMNNEKMAKEYLEKFKALNDSIKNEEKAAINIVINRLSEDEEREKQLEKNKMYFIISGLVILFLVSVYFIRRINLSKQLKNDRLLEEQTLKVLKLKKHLNDNSFDKVTQMAKEDSPFFLSYFKEVYPDFYEKLISHTPNLNDNDIRFCAYIKLNISNKEIAVFKNLTFRSVETTKYRLKKKLGLEVSTDLNKWINNL
ncbi:tetratricopeptide repeat protein [Chryseobacterium sp. G0201]|uniref:tetratricopeptide repeat protein n=1 Tax=Chryseobacterium sp. G0201 TaxID=2487065 RepID=UPI000F4FA281|nr:tetratricopeptide repeat protein [Chryseobacterium sp. G0201]AZA53207.1 tetratricopeptide repeat protein [Chryseobacterium sp. G0201]